MEKAGQSRLTGRAVTGKIGATDLERMKEGAMRGKMNRREFMVRTSSTILGAGLVAKGIGTGAVPPGTARVVEVYHPGSVLEKRRIDGAAVREMLRRGMSALTGDDRPWARFLRPGDRVGLKINTLGRPLLVTHRELVQAMVGELTDFGIKENAIVVWDRWEPHLTAAGYALNTSDKGVRCYGSEGRGPAGRRLDPEAAYESDFDTPEDRGDGTASLFSSIFTKECDKVINMAILKDHDTSGYTMCLKNLAFGLCHNNGRFHKPPHIGPFIAGFCAQPRVREKVVLHLIDALEACYDQGPVPGNPRAIFAPRTLWLGTDPVALDAVGYRALDAKRVEMGLPRLKDTPGYHGGMRPVDHIDLAAAKGIGVADVERIKVERLDLSRGQPF
jgi:uncharacterized protein (DUF362 family)